MEIIIQDYDDDDDDDNGFFREEKFTRFDFFLGVRLFQTIITVKKNLDRINSNQSVTKICFIQLDLNS